MSQHQGTKFYTYSIFNYIYLVCCVLCVSVCVFTHVYYSITHMCKSEVHLGLGGVLVGTYMLSHLTVIPIPSILKSK